MRKKYIILFVLILTNSFSVINGQINLLKKIDSLITKGSYLEALETSNSYVRTADKVSKSLIYNSLYLSSIQKDTVSALNYYTLGVKYFPETFSIEKLNEQTDKFDNDRYFGSFNDWFVNFVDKKIHVFHLIILTIFVFSITIGVTLKMKHKKGYNVFFIGALLFALVLFWSTNWNRFHQYEKYYIYDSKKELRLKPSYAASIPEEEINTGELMRVEDVSEVWVTLRYKGQKYYMSCTENPFIF